jgi:hypothetical protein
MLFLKQKPVVLTAYTTSALLAEMLAPKFAKAKPPRYYKTMPHRYKENPNLVCPVSHSLEYKSTIRQCYGIHKFNMSGILLPLWADYSVVTYQGNLSCCSTTGSDNYHSFHKNEQAPELLDDYNILKLESPWIFRCSDDTKFAVGPNFYDVVEYADKFIIPPAVDEYFNQTSTSFFLLFRKDLPDQEILLKFGTPFLKILPLTDRPVELRVELVDNLEKYKMIPPKYILSGSMAKLRQVAKSWNS